MATETEAPRPTGTIGEIKIQGALMPWHDGEPVLIEVVGSDDVYMPLFTTPEKLRITMDASGVPYTAIVEINDSVEFLQSLPKTCCGRCLRVIQDLYYLENGRVRYWQLNL